MTCERLLALLRLRSRSLLITGARPFLPVSAFIRRSLAAALLAVVPATALHAQVADTAKFPPDPSSIPVVLRTADPLDSGFGTWRRIPLPRHDNVPAAWTLRAGEWDFLMGTPRAMDAMDTSRVIDTTLANCRRPLTLSADDSLRAANARPWASFDSLVNDRPVLVISIMPVLRNFTECGWKNLGRPAMIRRGVRFVTSYTYDAARDPVSAVLTVRGRIVTPVMLARAPVVIISGGHEASLRTDQLRLYISYDAIAPDATGEVPPVELMIWTKADGEPDHIPLPGDILRQVWWEHLRWRAARLAAREAAPGARPGATPVGILRVPQPADADLKAAIRLQAEGRLSASSSLALERLAGEHLTANDRRIALMLTANSLQVAGDATASALLANELTAMDPCALSGSFAPGATVGKDAYTSAATTVAMLDHTRSGARCFAYAPGKVFLRGLIIPGYGQYSSWSPLIGKAVGAVTATGAVAALIFHLRAKSFYSTYQTTLNGYGPPYFQQAQLSESQAKSIAIETGAFWVLTAFEAEMQERVHARRLAVIHDFWFRPIMMGAAASGASAPAAAGGLTFHFR